MLPQFVQRMTRNGIDNEIDGRKCQAPFQKTKAQAFEPCALRFFNGALEED